jgi:dihydrofolate reductase
MRRIVAAEYLSLDGVGEDPGRLGGFQRRGWMIPYYEEQLAEYMSEQLSTSDALLLGRTTYEGFVSVWPARSGDPIADRMNSLPKFVASTTLREPLDWNATLLHGDVPDEVEKLKQLPGQDILIYGSGSLVHALMHHDLVDVYQLMLIPVLLGSGRRFFEGRPDVTTLRLGEVKTTAEGVVLLSYHRAAQHPDRSASVEQTESDWWLRRRGVESVPG